MKYLFNLLLIFFSAKASCSTLPVNCDNENLKTPRILKYEITSIHNYNKNYFTQGLFYNSGYIYISTGLYKKSSLNKIDFKTGKIVKEINLHDELFGEGSTLFKDEIFQLTWKSGKVFKYYKNNLKLKEIQNINTEGWGITNNKDHLIISDGSEFLYFRDPKTLEILSKLKVHFMGRRLRNLNELEWVDNCILANIWKTNIIAVINPLNGNTVATIDLSDIAKKENINNLESMPNGIAFLEDLSEILITGKHWKNIYQLKLK